MCETDCLNMITLTHRYISAFIQQYSLHISLSFRLFYILPFHIAYYLLLKGGLINHLRTSFFPSRKTSLLLPSLPQTHIENNKNFSYFPQTWVIINSDRPQPEDSSLHILFDSPWWTNYYHFITEALPLLIYTHQHLHRSRFVQFHLPSTPLWSEYLPLIQQFCKSIRISQRHQNVDDTIPLLALSQQPSKVNPNPLLIAQAHTFFSAVSHQHYPSGPSCTDLIFLVRDTGRRLTLLSDDARTLLSSGGFRFLNLSQFTTSLDIIRELSTASVIVSTHGAALVNSIAFSPQRLFIEIYSTLYDNPCIGLCSSLVGHRYIRIPSRPDISFPSDLSPLGRLESNISVTSDTAFTILSCV